MNKFYFESQVCPLCEDSLFCDLRFTKSGYAIHKCRSCNLMFVSPQPSTEEIIDLYGADYYERGAKYKWSKEHQKLDPNHQNDRVKLSTILRYRTSGRLLDVGCALGGFVKLASECGYDTIGLEVSRYAAEYCRNRLRVNIVNSSLPDAGFPSESFDIVTMWDVIEHTQNPWQYLEEIYRILRPGGHLFLTTGDAGSLWARLSGRFWELLTPPQHLFYFDQASMAKALHIYRFDLKECEHLGKVANLGFLMFKSREMLGPIMEPLKSLVETFDLNQVQVQLNFRDIMTCVAEKGLVAH